jgi:hypothetical protein
VDISWVKFELEICWSDTSSGYIKSWEDGVAKINKTSTATDDPGDGFATLGLRHEIVGGYQRAHEENNWRYWCDVYHDRSRARVLLGSHSTLAASTTREPQIITSWSTGSIGITVNLGKHSNGATAYVHVVKDDGTVLDNVMGAVTLGS